MNHPKNCVAELKICHCFRSRKMYSASPKSAGSRNRPRQCTNCCKAKEKTLDHCDRQPIASGTEQLVSLSVSSPMWRGFPIRWYRLTSLVFYSSAIYRNTHVRYPVILVASHADIPSLFPHWARYPNNWNNGTQLASEFDVKERFIRWCETQTTTWGTKPLGHQGWDGRERNLKYGSLF